MKIPVICQELYPGHQTKMGLRPNLLSYFYVCEISMYWDHH